MTMPKRAISTSRDQKPQRLILSNASTHHCFGTFAISETPNNSATLPLPVLLYPSLPIPVRIHTPTSKCLLPTHHPLRLRRNSILLQILPRVISLLLRRLLLRHHERSNVPRHPPPLERPLRPLPKPGLQTPSSRLLHVPRTKNGTLDDARHRRRNRRHRLPPPCPRIPSQ